MVEQGSHAIVRSLLRWRRNTHTVKLIVKSILIHLHERRHARLLDIGLYGVLLAAELNIS